MILGKKAGLAVALATCVALVGCAGDGVSRAAEPSQSQRQGQSETAEADVSAGADGDARGGSATSDASQDDVLTFVIGDAEFTMIRVAAGTFTMGSGDTDVQFSESPAHEVTLTQDYWIGETEVTEALWNAVMGSGGGSDTHPKTSIAWDDANEFAARLTELARERGLIGDDVAFCLPTEAQWEYAAKGGNLSQGYLYSGGDDIDEVAVTRENSGSDAPLDVKTKAPNELGIYDMSGNAYEWVADSAGDYGDEAQTDPLCSTGSGSHVKRGGSNYHSFASEGYLFTTTGRYFYGDTDWTIGMRLCLC